MSLGSLVSLFVLLAMVVAWGAGMSLMLIYGDRMSQTLIAQNSELQDAYEQRLQAFRAEIARLTLEIEQSKFDAGSVEGRVVEMGRRQRLIEARLVALYKLADLVAPGVVGAPTGLQQPQPAGVPTPPQRGGAGRPEPSGPPALGTPPQRRSSFDEGAPPVQVAQLGGAPVIDPSQSQIQSDIELFLERMDAALKRSEQSQDGALTLIYRVTESRVIRFKGALAEIGMSADSALLTGGRGEPAVPAIVLPISEQNTPFGLKIAQIRQNFALMHRMRFSLSALPFIKPTPDEIRYSSGFGFRMHPIHRIQRLHAGIDMAAPIGTPVRAAGSGVVLSAGWGGGYGNLIQVDHGNGIVTRYAHLSHMDVATGQPVSAGMLIGRMGTTGASTGSHLHFETRLRGTPVNPACFMLAGDRITGRTTVPLPCDHKPEWNRAKPDDDEEEDDDS